MPRKNIIDLAGKPLIAWTIDASLNSKYITKTVVSSDDAEILAIARRYGADALMRPDALATDTSSSQEVVEHAINSLSEPYDYVILLQPTSPLRDSMAIDDAFELFFQSDASALISVREIDSKILKAFKENELGYIEGISNNEYPFTRRQDLPKTYMSNGAIYIVKVDEFMKNSTLFTNKTISYLMNDVKSLDIDTVDDLKKARERITE